MNITNVVNMFYFSLLAPQTEADDAERTDKIERIKQLGFSEVKLSLNISRECVIASTG